MVLQDHLKSLKKSIKFDWITDEVKKVSEDIVFVLSDSWYCLDDFGYKILVVTRINPRVVHHIVLSWEDMFAQWDSSVEQYNWQNKCLFVLWKCTGWSRAEFSLHFGSGYDRGYLAFQIEINFITLWVNSKERQFILRGCSRKSKDY